MGDTQGLEAKLISMNFCFTTYEIGEQTASLPPPPPLAKGEKVYDSHMLEVSSSEFSSFPSWSYPCPLVEMLSVRQYYLQRLLCQTTLSFFSTPWKWNKALKIHNSYQCQKALFTNG